MNSAASMFRYLLAVVLALGLLPRVEVLALKRLPRMQRRLGRLPPP